MFIRSVLLLVAVLATGCASNPMTVSDTQQLAPPKEGQAQVIFMRSSFVGSAINASLYDVTGDEVRFIGIMANGTKVAYDTQPGERVFMVVSEAADFMEADLAPGKNYFSIVTPRMGAWKARFSMWPIKADSAAKYNTTMSEFDKWKESTTLVNNSDKARLWFLNNADSVDKKYEDYWPVWQEKSEEDIAQRTLTPGDGQ